MILDHISTKDFFKCEYSAALKKHRTSKK